METARRTAEPHDHVVQLYEREDELVDAVGGYLGDALRAGEAAIIVATPPHREAFVAALAADGIDIDAAIREGRFTALDAADLLSRFLVQGAPDPSAFDAVVGDLVRRVGSSGRKVRAYGEMVALLWDAGHVGAAIELESLWNGLGLQVPFSLFCAYPARSMTGDDQVEAFRRVCHLHSAVVGGGAGGGTGPAQRADGDVVSRYPCASDSPRAARRDVVDVLERWERTDLVDDAALIVAELASNAVLHAGTDFTVALRLHDGSVRLTVSDGSTARPLVRVAAPRDTSGRGMAMVAVMARRWGTDVVADGKDVWAEL